MDMSVSRSRAVKRLALAAILCCAGPTVQAEDTAFASTLQTVPSSDIVVFRSPTHTSGNHASAVHGSSIKSLGKSGYRFGSTTQLGLRAQRTSGSLAKLLGKQPAAPAQSSRVAPNLLNAPSAPRVAVRPPSPSMKRYIAPESVADMVRSIDLDPDTNSANSSGILSQSTSSRRGSGSSHENGSLSAFPLPSMEVLHSGRPVQQDAVNFKSPDYVSTQPNAPLRSPINSIEDQSRPIKVQLEARTRETAGQDGFEMFALDQLSPPSSRESMLKSEIPNVNSVIHANRLRELSAGSLRDAKSRLQRRATHSAQKYALEALRLAIDVEDSIAGSNQHMRDLQAGLAAIRESRDFGGIGSSVTTRTLQRMVAVHETTVLKETDLTQVSAFAATQSYLEDARHHLVRAASGSRVAAEALILLGAIEKQMPERANVHSGAVSLTYHRAATDVVPRSSSAHRAYGKTLLEQGLVRQSVQSLRQSLSIAPSRSGYESLLSASRRVGDVDTARHCLAALNDPRLPSDRSVKRLSPTDFASSYRPPVAAIPPQGSSVAASSVASQSSLKKPGVQAAAEPEKPRLSFRSLFSFGR